MRSVLSLKNSANKLINKITFLKKVKFLSYLHILLLALMGTVLSSYTWYISHVNKLEKIRHEIIKNELTKALEILKLTSARLNNCVSKTQVTKILNNTPTLDIKNKGLYYISEGIIYSALGQLKGAGRHLMDIPSSPYISINSNHYLSYTEPYTNSRLVLHVDNPIIISGTKYFANLKKGSIYIPEFGVYYSYSEPSFYAFIYENYRSLLGIFFVIACLILQIKATLYERYLRKHEQALIEENQILSALKGKITYLNRVIWSLRDSIELYKETIRRVEKVLQVCF